MSKIPNFLKFVRENGATRKLALWGGGMALVASKASAQEGLPRELPRQETIERVIPGMNAATSNAYSLTMADFSLANVDAQVSPVEQDSLRAQMYRAAAGWATVEKKLRKSGHKSLIAEMTQRSNDVMSNYKTTAIQSALDSLAAAAAYPVSDEVYSALCRSLLSLDQEDSWRTPELREVRDRARESCFGGNRPQAYALTEEEQLRLIEKINLLTASDPIVASDYWLSFDDEKRTDLGSYEPCREFYVLSSEHQLAELKRLAAPVQPNEKPENLKSHALLAIEGLLDIPMVPAELFPVDPTTQAQYDSVFSDKSHLNVHVYRLRGDWIETDIVVGVKKGKYASVDEERWAAAEAANQVANAFRRVPSVLTRLVPRIEVTTEEYPCFAGHVNPAKPHVLHLDQWPKADDGFQEQLIGIMSHEIIHMLTAAVWGTDLVTEEWQAYGTDTKEESAKAPVSIYQNYTAYERSAENGSYHALLEWLDLHKGTANAKAYEETHQKNVEHVRKAFDEFLSTFPTPSPGSPRSH